MKNKRLRRILSIGMVLLCFFSAILPMTVIAMVQYISPFEINNDPKLIHSYLYYFEDSQKNIPLVSIKNINNIDWRRNDEIIFNKGYNQSRWWLRLDISNNSNNTYNKYFTINYPVIDHINVVLGTKGLATVLSEYSLGDKLPFDQRLINNRNFIIPMTIKPHQQLTLILSIQSSSSIQLPVSLLNPEDFYKNESSRTLVQGILFGSMIVMLLFNLILFLTIFDKIYLYYVCYVLSMLVFLGSLKGFTFQYIWPEATSWNDTAIIFSLSMVVVFAIFFTQNVLNIDTKSRVWKMVKIFALSPAIIIALASFHLPYGSLIKPIIAVACIACSFGFYIGISQMKRHRFIAKYYTAAWSTVFFGGITMALSKIHIIPSNSFTENAVMIGSSLEFTLLSIALALKIVEEERKRRKAEREITSIQHKANKNLEAQVQTRTEQLEIANKKLKVLSERDGLTGLNNRRFLDATFAQEIARAIRLKFSIAFIILDIDKFKLFNDTYGHQVGDECLQEVAKCLQFQVCLPGDYCGRLGGEEFAVILPYSNSDRAYFVAESIRNQIEALKFKINGVRVPITISAGLVAMVPDDKSQSHLLMSNADEALYQAKDTGRNKVVSYINPRRRLANGSH